MRLTKVCLLKRRIIRKIVLSTLSIVTSVVLSDVTECNAEPIALRNPTATFSQRAGWNANLIVDGVTNDSAGWAVYDFGARSGAFAETVVVETEANVGFVSGSLLTFALYHVNHNPQTGLGRFRLSYTTDSRDTFADGLNSGGDVTANWTVMTPKTASATDGVVLTIQPDGSILASGANPAKTIYTVSVEVDAREITGFRMETIEDPSLPASGPGRAPNGNFVLTEFTASIAELPPPPPDVSTNVILKNAAATFSQAAGWNASLIVDGVTNDFAGWAIYDHGRRGAFAEAVVVETEADVGFATGSLLEFNLYHVNHNPQHSLGRFRLSYTTDSRDTFADGLNSGGDVTANWMVLTPKAASATEGAVLTIQADATILASGANPTKTIYTVSAEVAVQGITGFRIEVLEDPSLPDSGPGRYPSNGNFVLTEFTASISPLLTPPLTDFDLARDFSSASNPSGAWSYGWSGTLGGGFTALTVQHVSTADGGVQVPSWQLTSYQTPAVYRNTSGGTIGVGGGLASIPAGTVWYYPGENGRLENFGVIRFTAPSNGTYSVEVAVAPVYPGPPQGDTDFHVVKNGAELFGRSLAPSDSASFADTIVLAAGNTIDFAIGRGADGSSYGSGLRIQATLTPVDSTDCAPAATGLVAWWRLDGNAQDAVGESDGTLAGSPVFTEGLVGQGLLFDGANDLIRVPASSALNVGAGEGLTIEGWILPANLSQLRPIAEWNSGSIGAAFWTGVDTGAPGDGIRSLFGNLVDTSGISHQIRTAPNVVSTGVWQHVAITYDKASGAAVIYYNGTAAAQTNLGTFTPQTSTDLYWGNRPAGPFSGIYWSGAMDEMCLYGRALAAVDIQSIFNAGAAGKCLPPQPPVCAPAPNGLIGWWPFESDGSDIIGDNSGTLVGGPSFSPGQVGESLRFDGINDSVRVPAGASINVGAGDGFTIEGWINPADLAHLRPIAEWNSGSIGVHFWTGVDTAGPGDGERNLFANLVDTSGGAHQVRTPRNLVTTGAWQHVALTYSKTSGQAAIYYNGAIAGQANLGTFTPATAGALNFGNRPSGPFSGIYWRGGMDEMSLYGRALAATDIAAVYSAGVAGKCAPPPPPPTNGPILAGLVGWWPLEGNADDIIGNHDGTLSGSPLFADGKVAQGLRFDGANDLVRVPSAPGLNVGAGPGFTIEGWINPADLSHLRPIAEWNGNSGVSGIGALFWAGVRVVNPGDGDRNLTANLIDTAGASHHINTAPGLVTTGVWQHVALTYDKVSGQAAIYYNGAVAAQANLGSFTPLTTGDLYFGNRPSGPFSGIYWSGGMDEMSLYSRALAAADIQTIYNAGSAGKSAPTNPPPVNHAPVAKAVVGPLFELWSDETTLLIISGNGEDAEVQLDASTSSDPDGDALEFVWTEEGEPTPFAAGILATNNFALGAHTIVLVANDGEATDADAVEIEVITLSEAVEELILFVSELDLSRKEKRQLLATLNRVWDSFEDEHLRSGIKQLGAFQQKVRAHLLKAKPTAGRKLIEAAEQIIDAATAAMDDDGYPKKPRRDRKR